MEKSLVLYYILYILSSPDNRRLLHMFNFQANKIQSIFSVQASFFSYIRDNELKPQKHTFLLACIKILLKKLI